MRFDIPECNRCFLCVPLRYGIIIFGYLNLFFALFAPSVETVWMIERGNGTANLTFETVATYKGVSFFTQTWLILLLYAIEVVFNVVLLIGAHMKRIELIRVYYYYGITTILGSFATFLVMASRYIYIYLHPMELSVTFLGLGCLPASQAYLLLLIRTEMRKWRYGEGITNYECTNNLNSQHPPNWREPDVRV